MKKPVTTLVLSLTVGLSAGILIGIKIRPEGGADIQRKDVALDEVNDDQIHYKRFTQGKHIQHGDPQYALKELVTLPGGLSRIHAMSNYVSQMSFDQLVEEAMRLKEMPCDIERRIAAKLVFGRLGEIDAQSAFKISDGEQFIGSMSRWHVLEGWASNDPERAAKYVEENTDEFLGLRREDDVVRALQIVAFEWAKQHPEHALEWALSMQQNKSIIVLFVMRELSRSNPKKAASLIDQTNLFGHENDYMEPHYRESVFSYVVEAMAKEDPQEAADFRNRYRGLISN